MIKQLPKISVIIPTKNEATNIANCLTSVKNQTYPQKLIETIVVDNKSNDETKLIARRFNARVYKRGPERSSQRNFGAAKATGDYLLFLDADMIISSTLLEKCREKTVADNFVGLYIPELVIGLSYWHKVRRFERSFYDGTPIDAVRFVEKSAFKKAGGFDTRLTGPEDWDFDKKVNQTGKTDLTCHYNFDQLHQKLNNFNYNQNNWVKKLTTLTDLPLLFHNELDFNFSRYLRKKSYYSASFAPYVAKWGKNDTDVKKQLGFYYRYFGVFWQNNREKKLFTYPHLSFGMYFLKFWVGLLFIRQKLKY